MSIITFKITKLFNFPLQIIAFGVLFLSVTSGRRVRVRPARPIQDETDQEEQQQQVEYYAQDPQDRDDQQQNKVVLVSNSDVYNGLYGRALDRTGTDSLVQARPLSRASLISQTPRQARVKDTPKEPPVQTIRNYSKVNDDGSFTFGYESADGSFKEETRGTDCVVRGKYGYVDPDGNKREFTYVSGNPCDPNAPQEEEKEEQTDDSGEENVPQNIPRRPLRPRPTIKSPARPATTLFQQSFNTDNNAEQEDDDDQVYVQPSPVRTRLPARPISVPVQRPQSLVRVTPRPVTSQPTTLPATTYRPQLLVSVTPRPNVVYTKHSTLSRPSSPVSSTSGSVDFDAELKRFQLENNAVTTPRTIPSATTSKSAPLPTGQPIYTSELVYDPATGQYNTVVYQQLPKTSADVTLKARLPQYIQPQPQYITRPQPTNQLQQQLFQQQKQALFQQSQDLYNQQRQQQLQTQHRFQSTVSPPVQYPVSSTLAPAATKPLKSPQQFQTAEQNQRLIQRPSTPQQFYYFAPQLDAQAQSIAAGQIDAFLRGHNLQF